MEVFFLDVGQGTSNVVLIGGRHAIVIDTGQRASDLRLFLNHFSVDFIECLVLSHLDADHSGGAVSLITEYRGRIGNICFPNDHRMLQTRFWKQLWTEIKGGHLNYSQLVRLEFEDKPKTVWESKALSAELKILSPTFGENQIAIGSPWVYIRYVLPALPGLTIPVFTVTTVWMLLAMIVAVRQALDYSSTRRAVAVCVLGWVLAIVFAMVVGFFFGPRVS
jgi:hypothetical protein